MLALLTAWGLGVLLGVRHATEPDHLAAVSTLVARRGSSGRAASLGALWGLGHSVALLLAGGVLLAMRMKMTSRVAHAFELAVAVMLITLGIRTLAQAFRAGSDGPAIPHAHGRHHHAHAGVVDHLHVGHFTVARAPFLVGIVHGLAGSGTLTALAMSAMPSVSAALVFMALFGLGSVAGMATMTGTAGLLVRWFVTSPRRQRGLAGLSGAASVCLGILWGWTAAIG